MLFRSLVLCSVSTPTEASDCSCVALSYTARICLCIDGKLSIYETYTGPLDMTVVGHLWTYPADVLDDMTRPLFGQDHQTLTWFNATKRKPWRHVGLTAAIVPSAPPPSHRAASSRVHVYTMVDPDGPALHAMGVRDFDEVLGILVLGNACGELTVYDLTGRCSTDLEDCFTEVSMPAVTREELLSTVRSLIMSFTRFSICSQVPVASSAALPFPYSLIGPRPSGAVYVPPIVGGAMIARWRADRPLDVPGHWTADVLFNRKFPQSKYVSAAGKEAWRMERVRHYLGTITPLLFREKPPTTIFKAGGLLFVHFITKDSIFVLRPGVSAPDAARAINERENGLVVACVSDETISCTDSLRYIVLWQWEKFTLGINRWKGLEERGGAVNPGWLAEKLITSKELLQ